MKIKEVLVLIILMNLFLMTISTVSATEIIVDDGDTGYSDNGWTLAADQGYDGDVHYIYGANAGKIATWTPQIIDPGDYNVYVSWTVDPNRATNAPYTVNYNGGSYPEGLNQEFLADGSTSPSGTWSGWYYLGTFDFISGTSGTVTLDDNADDYVIADAVKFEFVNTIYVDDAGDCEGKFPCYTKIQDAIDAADSGFNIKVLPGTYNENQIVIDKPLTIIGAGIDSSFINGGNDALTEVGLVRIIANLGDVTFSGFTLENAGGPAKGLGDGKLNVGIYTESDTAGVTYTISNNKIYGTNNPDDDEDYGLYSNSGKENLVFTNNIITQTGANAILLEKHTGPTDVSHNTLDEGTYGSTAYFSMTYDGIDITSLQKVDNNMINVGTGVHTGSDFISGGITFNSASHYGSGDGKYTNLQITDNTIYNLKGYRRGISLVNDAGSDGSAGDINSPVITGNIITGVTGVTDSRGIQLFGLVTNAIIKDNKVNNLDKGFYITAGKYGSHYATGTTFRNNFIVGNNFGLQWDGTYSFDAKLNWWGSNTGPYHLSNPSGTGDKVSDNVDFEPWLESILTLTSPEHMTYNTCNIPIVASASLTADEISYSDNDGPYRRLCSNCDSYNRKKTFSEGSHELVVRATLDSAIDSKTVNFFVDCTPPKIIKTLPEKGEKVNITKFYIKYTEDNLVKISLHWKESTDVSYNTVELTGCPSGRNKECTYNLLLPDSNGKMIDYYFEVQDPANTVTSQVKTITYDIEKPVVTIISPVDIVYPSRKIDLNIEIDEVVERLEYSLDDVRFNRLCSNCDSYNRKTSFSDGEYTLVVRATDLAGNVGQSSIHFNIDSKPPKIIREYPQDRKYTNGTFIIEYTEENVKEITLYYKGIWESTYKTKPLTTCESGKNKECVFNVDHVDLSAYNGLNINYYFVVRNDVAETTGRVHTVNVDTTIPVITIHYPEEGNTYHSRSVRLYIDVTEDVKLEMSDNGFRFRTLCTKCDSYDRSQTFSYGTHQLQIRAVDKAENSVMATRTFYVVA
ncbi:MAG: hypothetical protein NTW30_03935 [Candidatus Aenigmarchaeota archaeon]|nr:hypothetical protein [Candidatus Aenigmarchaeota archaeon]